MGHKIIEILLRCLEDAILRLELGLRLSVLRCDVSSRNFQRNKSWDKRSMGHKDLGLDEQIYIQKFTPTMKILCIISTHYIYSHLVAPSAPKKLTIFTK